MEDSLGRYTHAYDELGRKTLAVNPAGKRITYAYDAVAQRDWMDAAGAGRFTYAYNDAGRMDHLVNPQDERTTWSYYANGGVESRRMANGTRASHTYDGAGRLTRLANLKSDGSIISRFTYTYDNAGNRTTEVRSEPALDSRTTFSYDNTYQLTSEHRTGTSPFAITHTYDALGNRLEEHHSTGGRTTSTYDAANQLDTSEVSSGTTTYTYDAVGNLTVTQTPSNQRTTNTWDCEGRLTRAALADSALLTFQYDSGGKRVQKEDSEDTCSFIWDLENVLLETNADDATLVDYTVEPAEYGNLISQRRSTATSYYHFDGIGSTDRLTDSAGNTIVSYTYEAFGALRASSGNTVNPFKYVGEKGYYDDVEPAHYYLRARYYDPAVQRFTSRDPMALDNYDVNQYSYVANQPTVAVDPSGLQKCPAPWKAGKVLGKVWQYGCYCGLEPVPPRKKIPPPIDPIDKCCQKHDACFGKMKGVPAKRKKCNKQFCTCAKDANGRLCPEKAKNIVSCCRAARWIIAVCDRL